MMLSLVMEKEAKIMIGADLASPYVGRVQQRGLCNDFDWILACEYLHKY